MMYLEDLEVNSPDDSTFDVYTWVNQVYDNTDLSQEQYYVGAQATDVTCYNQGGYRVGGAWNNIQFTIHCQNWFSDCPIELDATVVCAGAVTTSAPVTTQAPVPTQAPSTCGCDGCTSQVDVSASGTYTISRAEACPYGQVATIADLNIRVDDYASNDPSSFTVVTKDSPSSSSYYSDLSSTSAVTCFNKASVTYSSTKDNVYVVIECQNFLDDCPIEYNVAFGCSGSDDNDYYSDDDDYGGAFAVYGPSQFFVYGTMLLLLRAAV